MQAVLCRSLPIKTPADVRLKNKTPPESLKKRACPAGRNFWNQIYISAREIATLKGQAQTTKSSDQIIEEFNQNTFSAMSAAALPNRGPTNKWATAMRGAVFRLPHTGCAAHHNDLLVVPAMIMRKRRVASGATRRRPMAATCRVSQSVICAGFAGWRARNHLEPPTWHLAKGCHPSLRRYS
ncbi:MAG: hypothetical protein FWD68_18915, partial [Alphaproteobacteria bacterium]|nr:hypothetical protein [Alphaproteobacteria bacterium]